MMQFRIIYDEDESVINIPVATKVVSFSSIFNSGPIISTFSMIYGSFTAPEPVIKS